MTNINEESDDESVATNDITEEPVAEELVPEPVEPEPQPEPELQPEPEPENKKPKKGKRLGRPKKQEVEKADERDVQLKKNVSNYSKTDLLELLEHQYQENKLLREKEMLKVFEKSKKPKEKKARTQKQIEATQRLVEANKRRAQAKRSEIKAEVEAEVKGDIANQVQEEIVKIIHNPARSLTPERVKKVEAYTEKTTRKNRFS